MDDPAPTANATMMDGAITKDRTYLPFIIKVVLDFRVSRATMSFRQFTSMRVILRRLRPLLLAATAFTSLLPHNILAQGWVPAISVTPLMTVTGDSVDQLRLRTLVDSSAIFPLLRSPSSLAAPLGAASYRPLVSLISPELRLVTNSAIPFSQNAGSLWAGRGTNLLVLAGLRIEAGPLRIIAAPELVNSANDYWQIRDTVRFYAPPLPEDRSGGGFVFPWYRPPHSIDQPLRMGDKSIHHIVAGQSSALFYVGPVALGAATENEWWGPGVRNAIVLSNNAGGFPHLVIRTSTPRKTRVGSFDARLLVGGISESGFFDTTSTNNLRAISLAALSYKPAAIPRLDVGFARAVYGTVDEWGTIPGRILRSFSNPGRPNNRALSDSLDYPGGEDQVYSLFARWAAPADGFEAYTEISRTELPSNLRDLLVAPNHTQGYTLGFQWRKPTPWNSSSFRIQGEATNIEQSATFRDRPVGSYYTSRKVIQGYTHQGKVIGASIGPGASSQWVALDYNTPTWYAGPFAGRIRWNEDMHSVYGWPAYIGYCSHDVTIYTGARGAYRSRWLTASAEYTLGNRLNAWFQEQSGCPNGPSRLDIRNNTLSLTLSSRAF
jgi:hypothetical protein